MKCEGGVRLRVDNAILKRYVLRLLRNEDSFSDDFNLVGTSFEMIGAVAEKSCQDLF